MKEKTKRGTTEKRLLAACLFLAAAGLLMVCARQIPGFAEWYAVHIYQKLVAVAGRGSGLVPFSVAEMGLYVLLALLPVTGARAIVKSVRFGQGGENALRWASGLFLTASALMFLYAANCGVNYQRDSFSEKTGLTARQYTAEELRDVCLWLTEEVNARVLQVERGGSGEMLLTMPADGTQDGTEPGKQFPEKEQEPAEAEHEEMPLQVLGDTAVQAMTDLAEEYPDLKGYYPHPKPVCVSEILSYQNLSGVYSPFTVEANYNADMVDYNIPFTLCHELSHLRGFMQEEEANFIAFLACIGSENGDFEYSGYLTGWVYCMNALRRADAKEWQKVRESLDETAEANLRENSRFWDRYDGTVAEVSDKVNDTYLKVNGQSEGVQSYGRMVDLIIAYAKKR